MQSLGPDSLTWRYFGDFRTNTLMLRAGILQNMLEPLGQGVVDHSNLFQDSMGRLLRSAGPIMKVVYAGPEAPTWGDTIRGYHHDIKGDLASGERYHALDPSTFYWAHATFFEAMLQAIDTLMHPLSDAEREQLFEEHKTWYRLYGVSDAPMPATYADFTAYFDHMVNDVLISTKAARFGVGWARSGMSRPAQVPARVWPVIKPVVEPLTILVMVGNLPARSREQLGLTWTARDQRRLLRLQRWSRRVSPVYDRLPTRLRYITPAHEGFRRAR